MNLINWFRVADRVMVTAKDDSYAYIDGWRGRVIGFESGAVWIKVDDEGVDKRFLVPADELALTV
jgi:hypothetical protein